MFVANLGGLKKLIVRLRSGGKLQERTAGPQRTPSAVAEVNEVYIDFQDIYLFYLGGGDSEFT